MISNDTAILMTMLFAYLGVAYFVASKLTRFQAASVSVLYSVFQFFWIYSIWDGMINMSVVVLAFTNQQYRFDAIQYMAYSSTVVWILAWILSLAVFIQRRRMAEDSGLSTV